eukprot:2353990-Rhodomonas_salina.1
MIWIGLDFWPSWPSLYLFGWSMLALGIAHIALRTLLGKRLDESGQYFLLHVLANTYIVAAALPDTLHVLAHPLDALDETDRLSHGTVLIPVPASAFLWLCMDTDEARRSTRVLCDARCSPSFVQ